MDIKPGHDTACTDPVDKERHVLRDRSRHRSTKPSRHAAVGSKSMGVMIGRQEATLLALSGRNAVTATLAPLTLPVSSPLAGRCLQSHDSVCTAFRICGFERRLSHIWMAHPGSLSAEINSSKNAERRRGRFEC